MPHNHKFQSSASVGETSKLRRANSTNAGMSGIPKATAAKRVGGRIEVSPNAILSHFGLKLRFRN